MDSIMKISVVTLLVFFLAASTGAASNSTTDSYTEPEEISDSIPVAITILVILVLLLLIFIIILLLICVRLLSKSTRSKDFELEQTTRSYRNDSPYHRHSQPPAERMEPVEGQQHTPVVYVSPRNQLRKSQPQSHSIHGHACNALSLYVQVNDISTEETAGNRPIEALHRHMMAAMTGHTTIESFPSSWELNSS